jgi:replicative DNA helicase
VYTKNELDNTAEIIISKNRNGIANMKIDLLFEKQYTRFVNLAK